MKCGCNKLRICRGVVRGDRGWEQKQMVCYIWFGVLHTSTNKYYNKYSIMNSSDNCCTDLFSPNQSWIFVKNINWDIMKSLNRQLTLNKNVYWKCLSLSPLYNIITFTFVRWLQRYGSLRWKSKRKPFSVVFLIILTKVYGPAAL